MQSYVELLNQGMVKHTGLRWDMYEPGYSRFMKTDSMKGRYKDVQTWKGFPRPGRRTPGMGVDMGDIAPTHSKRYIMVYYALGTMIPQEDWDSDETGVLAKEIPTKGGAFATSHAVLREQVVADWFRTVAFATDGNNTPGMSDGRPLFSTAHPFDRSGVGTWSNRPTVGADLSVGSLQAGCTNLRKQKAPNQQMIIKGGPQKLVVAPDNQYTGLQLVRSVTEPGTANRNQNFLANDNIELVVYPYWSVASAAGTAASVVNGWALFGDGHSVSFLIGNDPKVESQYKLEVRSMLYVCQQSFAVGADNPWAVYGSPGT